MTREPLNCWHCGTALDTLPLPIGRREECPHCSSSLHVCRMCAFFERSASRMCREPMADEVTDKEQANFCDYFRPRAGLTASADQEAANSRARLEALFGGLGAKPPAKPGAGPKPAAKSTESARRKLDALFEDEPE
jgi:hypothetical protein